MALGLRVYGLGAAFDLKLSDRKTPASSSH